MIASAALSVENKWTNGAVRFAEQRRTNDLVGYVRKSLHHEQDGANCMRDNTTSRAGTPPEHLPVTKRAALRLVSSGLQSALRNASAPVKRIAKIAEVDRKTAAAWYHGHSAPGLHHLLNLMAEIPELAGEIRRVTQMERDTHEDLQREIAALIQKAMRR